MENSKSCRHMWCQGCHDTTVREISAAPCPHCHRCAFCGQKLGLQETQCTCLSFNDPEKVEEFFRDCGIKEEQVPRERHRATIRQQLQTPKAIAQVLTIAFVVAATTISGDLAGTRLLNKLIVFLVVDGIVLIACFKVSSRIFQIIEDRRLDREFDRLEQQE